MALRAAAEVRLLDGAGFGTGGLGDFAGCGMPCLRMLMNALNVFAMGVDGSQVRGCGCSFVGGMERMC